MNDEVLNIEKVIGIIVQNLGNSEIRDKIKAALKADYNHPGLDSMRKNKVERLANTMGIQTSELK